MDRVQLVLLLAIAPLATGALLLERRRARRLEWHVELWPREEGRVVVELCCPGLPPRPIAVLDSTAPDFERCLDEACARAEAELRRLPAPPGARRGG